MNIATEEYSKVEPVKPVEAASNNMDQSLSTELQVVFESQLHEEDEWLIDVCAELQSKDQIESWTSHHASKSRDESAVPRTIICVMPCIDNVSHAPEFQTYLMRIAISYTEYLNPHQTVAVGSSDLPLYALKKGHPVGFSVRI